MSWEIDLDRELLSVFARVSAVGDFHRCLLDRSGGFVDFDEEMWDVFRSAARFLDVKIYVVLDGKVVNLRVVVCRLQLSHFIQENFAQFLNTFLFRIVINDLIIH